MVTYPPLPSLSTDAPAYRVEDVLTTAELETRPSRAPDFRQENEALTELARHMASSPDTLLQKLVELALVLCHADSAGVSLEDVEGGLEVFRWVAVAGRLASIRGGTLARSLSPCAVVVSSRTTQMMRTPGRYFPYIGELEMPIQEVLLIPFFVGDKPVGTIWLVSHDEAGKFQAEDVRLISSLAGFASAASQTLKNLAQAEKDRHELEDTRTKLEAALGAGCIATWSWDILADRVYADQHFAEFFAVSEEDSRGGPLSAYLKFIYPDDLDRVRGLILRSIERGEHYEAEYRVIGRNGELRWVIARGEVLYNSAGQAAHFPGVVFDITARKEAQLELDRSQQALWAKLPVACFTLDLSGKITFYNDAAARLWGRAPQLGEESWSGAVALLNLDETALPVEEGPSALAVREKDALNREMYVLRADGSRRCVSCHAVPVRDSQGVLRQIICVDFDVTEERLASRAKDDFLATLSHELRTPLTPVILATTDLENDPSLSPEVREQLTMMSRNLELEARLIDDLLDLTRIRNGKFKITPEVADVHQLIHYTDEILRTDARKRQISVSYSLVAAHHHVLADSARLQQVFWNLIKNSLKFTPQGGHVQICTVNDDEDRLRIVIQDSGIGISPETLPHVFNAFEQGEIAGQHRYGGLGLGLAISRVIISAHGGSIRAESEGLNCGASFIVELATTDASLPARAKAITDRLTSPKALRLLLVEDHEATRVMLSRLLSRGGHTIVSASTVAEALAAFEGDFFDAVITDVGLPDGNGIDLIRILRRQREIPCIALTGHGTEEDIRKYQDAPVFAHLIKPVSADQLRRLLETLPSGSGGGVVG